jgi:hypothetical protein
MPLAPSNQADAPGSELFAAPNIEDTGGINGNLNEGAEIVGVIHSRSGKPLSRICANVTGILPRNGVVAILAPSNRQGRYEAHGPFPRPLHRRVHRRLRQPEKVRHPMVAQRRLAVQGHASRSPAPRSLPESTRPYGRGDQFHASYLASPILTDNRTITDIVAVSERPF